jgi:DNA/RNA-binding domain of Phe-tRNA-synthetase-like protein
MQLILSKAISDKIRGLTVSLAKINRISYRYDKDNFNNVILKLGNLCKERFKSADKLISSKIINRYHSFFRDTLKLNLAEIKPKNEISGTLILSDEEIKFDNPIEGLTSYLSGATGYPIFIFDADLIKGNLNLRYAKKGEKFKNEGSKKEEILEGKEVVISDNEKIILKYPYMLSREIRVNEKSKNILILICGIPGIVGLNLLWALKLSVKLILEIFTGDPHLILQELVYNEEEGRETRANSK